jgi:GT2 family glycosyltransferase
MMTTASIQSREPLPHAVADPWRRVSVVAVSHDSAAVIGPCLSCLGAGAEIILVDNESRDESREVARRARPDLRILHNAVGLGYGNGANCGLRLAGREFVLLINPDARLEPGAFERLIAAAERYPEAGVLAPALRGADGALAPSHNVGLFARPDYPARRDDPPPEGDLCADHVSGAVMLLRRTAIDAVGLFDASIFLYYDDDDLCLRMRQHGWSILLVADAVAEHIGGASVRPSRQARWEKYWHMAWSRLYMEHKYRGRRAMLRLALPTVLRYLGKSLAYLVSFNLTKLARDAARLCGSVGYLMGVAAMPRAGRRR